MPGLSEIPIWRNLVARTLLWYLVMGWLFYWLRDVAPVDAGVLSSAGFDRIATGNVPADGQVAPTPIGDYTYQSAALQNQQYNTALNARTQQQAGLYGALGGIAGAGLYGLMPRR